MIKMLASFMLAGALWLGAGCRAREEMSEADLLAETLDEMETYYWAHGRMPVGTKDLSPQWHALMRGYPGFQGLSVTWRVLKPRGYDRSEPNAAVVYLEAKEKAGGKVIACTEGDVDLALKGQEWTVHYLRPSLHKFIPIDDPYNIACYLADSICQSHRSTGTWERAEVLLARNDQWLGRDVTITRTVASFRSRIDEAHGKVLLILSCGVDGNDYIFDTSGYEDHKPPAVRPTRGQTGRAKRAQ